MSRWHISFQLFHNILNLLRKKYSYTYIVNCKYILKNKLFKNTHIFFINRKNRIETKHFKQFQIPRTIEPYRTLQQR